MYAAGTGSRCCGSWYRVDGGGSPFGAWKSWIEEKTGINTVTAEDPMTAVAIGTGKFVELIQPAMAN